MPAGNSFATESASATLSVAHAAPPCHTNRYTRFVAPPLAGATNRVAPTAARPRQPEPRGRKPRPPHDLRADGIDPHQAVLPVAVVRDEHGPVGQREEVERQRADRHLTPGGPDAPARRELRRAVTQRSGDEAGGEERSARERRQQEQEAFEHGGNIAARASSVSPLGLAAR